jgi:hypothetical protein
MAGLPGIDSLSTYGDAKSNYAPVEDPTTDEDAAHRNLYAANVAAMTQTAPRAICRFVGHGTTPTDPASNVHFAVWGNDVSVKPVVAHSATGVFTITWPSTITDELGEEHSVNLVDGWPNVNGSTLYHAQVTITAPNVATVYVFNSAGAANDAVGVTIAVFVR